MQEIFIVDGLRTGIGSFGGTLKNFCTADLGKIVVSKLLERNKLEKDKVDEIIIGSVLQAGQGQNIARQISINSNIPVEKTSMTINMVCGSGLRSVILAAQAIKANDADIIIAGGAENMSQAPYIINGARFGYKMGHNEITDSMIKDGLWDIFNNYHMGITAENLAEKYKITREEQDVFACKSQIKAEKAIKNQLNAAKAVAKNPPPENPIAGQINVTA